MAKDKINKEQLQPLAEIDRVIHEPARLLILAYLSVVESADFLFLMNQTALTRVNQIHTTTGKFAGCCLCNGQNVL